MRRHSDQPELAHEAKRSPALSYEPPGSYGVVRVLEHGFATALTRWHYHPEYELHLITSTRAKASVGDHIGHHEAGYLALTRPRLPHNWMAVDAPPAGPQRAIHKVLQFRDEPLRAAAEQISELGNSFGLLDRARFGIEFSGLRAQADQHFEHIKASHGLPRLMAFLAYLNDLAQTQDYRLLSSVSLQSFDGSSTTQITSMIDYLLQNYADPMHMANVARYFGMPEKYFSKYFRKSTGNTFTDFVCQLHINRAAQLLAESEHHVASIAYEVGFNNMANFNRRFLALKGMSPQQARQRANGRS